MANQTNASTLYDSYEYYLDYVDLIPVDERKLKANKYLIVIAFWVSLALFVMLLFLILLYMSWSGSSQQSDPGRRLGPDTIMGQAVLGSGDREPAQDAGSRQMSRAALRGGGREREGPERRQGSLATWGRPATGSGRTCPSVHARTSFKGSQPPPCPARGDSPSHFRFPLVTGGRGRASF
uniref:Melanocortin 2 receptor accessory protein n=1 Tax=Felis catus TaxID=9685 RepID=A0ABI7XXZ6_FELCA